MKDLSDARLFHLKGGLFLLLGVLGSGALLLALPHMRTALLLPVTVWGYCRFYYYTFYVITHYADPGFRFSGLRSFAVYVLRTRGRHERRQPRA